MRYSYVTAGASPRPTMRFFHGSLREGAAAGGAAGGECGRKEVQSRKPCEARAPSVTAMPCHLPPGGRQCPLRHAPRATSPGVRGILRRVVGRGLAPAAFPFKHGIAKEWFGTIYRSRPYRIRKMRYSYVTAGASPRRVFHMAISLGHNRMIFVIQSKTAGSPAVFGFVKNQWIFAAIFSSSSVCFRTFS